MKLYREATPLEIVDSKAMWIMTYLTPVDLTDGDIDDIVNSFAPGVNVIVIAPDDLYVEFGRLCAREAIMLLLSKLKGDG